MKNQTIQQIAEIVFELWGEKFSPLKAKIWMQVLAPYSDDSILESLNMHIVDPVAGKWPPKPADIIAKMPAKPSSMNSDEAWSICLASFDEGISLVWNDRIAQARAAAYPIWEIQDKVGARMAFKASYDRLQGVTSEVPVLSLGSDTNAREEAVIKAQRLGIISNQRAQELLPSKVSVEVDASMKMLTGKPSKEIPTNGYSRMKAIIEDALKRAEEKEAAETASKEQQSQAEKNKREDGLQKLKQWAETIR